MDADGERVCLRDNGAQGSIWAHTWVRGNEIVQAAVQDVQLPKMMQAEQREKIKSMLYIWQLAGASSPHACELYGICWRQNRAMVVTPRYPRTLYNLVKQQHPTGLPRATALQLAWELASALEALHLRAKSQHLDVKPANVLLTTADLPAVRLTDFGVAKSMSQSSDLFQGASGYSAPEQMLQGSAMASADVYGLGATLMFALTGVEPYAAMAALQVAAAADAAAHLPLPDELQDSELRQLVQYFTAREPASRPSITDAANTLWRLCGANPSTCPVKGTLFTAGGGTVPTLMPCCNQVVTWEGLEQLQVVGPWQCPHCWTALPEQPISRFHVNSSLMRQWAASREGAPRELSFEVRPCHAHNALQARHYIWLSVFARV